MTPKKNCKECGSPTCMDFSLKVSQGIADISACPYLDNGTELYGQEKTGEMIVCPNCQNDIEEGMAFCPYCDEKILEMEENTEENFVSDTNETSAIPSGENLELIDLYTSNENNETVPEENIKQINLYNQNENDVDFFEESIEPSAFFDKSANNVCPNCENDIEEGMVFCPYCGTKIEKKEENAGEGLVSDTNKTSEAVHEENIEISAHSNPNENDVTLQGKSVESSTIPGSNEASADFQEEIPEAGPVPTPNKFEDTDNKEIPEVFVTSDRNKIRAAFERALVVINKIEDALLKHEEFDRQKDSIEKKKKEIEEELTDIEAVFFGLGVIVLIILFVIGYRKNEGSILSGILCMVIFGIGYYMVASWICASIELANGSPKKAKAEKWYGEQIAILNAEKDGFLKKFEEYCGSNEVIFARKIVPEEYFDSESVQFFIKMLNNGRADTYKEVINLYEEHLHRERVENMQMQSLELQGENLNETRQLAQNVKAQNEQMQKQTEYMKQISRNTKSTARAVKINAFIGAVSGHSQSKQLKQIKKNTR